MENQNNKIILTWDARRRRESETIFAWSGRAHFMADYVSDALPGRVALHFASAVDVMNNFTINGSVAVSEDLCEDKESIVLHKI